MADNALSDDFPVLLGPVRVETRFTATELLVRVFPDEWSVDTFEPRPTEAELGALDAYWTALWRTGGSAVGDRAAWQELVGRIAAGRATWLLQNHRPANPADRPVPVPAGTTVLVVLSDAALPAADRQPTTDYWTAVWRAHGDRVKQRAADTALLAAVGPAGAAAITARRPAGIEAAPVQSGDAVLVAFLVVPRPADADIAPQSWTVAARAGLLPDHFRLLGWAGGAKVLDVDGNPVPATLPVGPDPGNTEMRVDESTGVLTVPDELRWLTDFDRAVTVGMGFRVPLTADLAGGLDRLVVLGLRAGATPTQSAADLTGLLTRQLRSPAGLSLLPQGTPTNNSAQAPAGLDPGQEADAGLRSAAHLRALAPGADWTTRTDGQCFAELLGVDPADLAGMPGADGTDQRDARAADTALWPATWGYHLQTTLHPVFSRAVVEQTREYYLRHVSGRGPAPTVRIGRQPYGILPTTAFSRLAWPDTDPAAAHRRGLNTVLQAAAADWQAATGKVAHLGGPAADAHQHLLDILAAHPTSAEYYQRYAQSVEDVFNRENLGALGSTVLPGLDRLNQPGPIRALLTRFGYPDTGAAQDPDLIRRLFLDTQHPLLAPPVDDRPLSETDPIRPYTLDGANYLTWLAAHARTDLETVRTEAGFPDDDRPAALLYLLARHALLLGWADAATELAVAAGIATTAEQAAADPAFIHVKIPAPGQSLPSESRFRRLYSPAPEITGDPARLVVDHIPRVIDTSPATARLAEQTAALGLLTALPTARLERVLAEHLDTATYRLDAWRLGLANERLAELRYGPDGTTPAVPGVHLGAYGWLEDVRRRDTALTPVTLTGPLATVFQGDQPLMHDPLNGGHLHAPSPGHARTAAVLRAGYLANGSPDNPGSFAVNLSSGRVRTALGLLDGMRQGQSLGALLGYRLERDLHDSHEQAEVDFLIAALRLKFPLRAGRIADTVPQQSDQPDPTKPLAIDRIEAHNVIDGLALVRHLTRENVPQTYPYGLDGLPAVDTTQQAVVDLAVQHLLDLHDALADLAVAESTHQALLGNPERASATLDAYAKEGLPPEPAVVTTPRSGTTLTHRLGLRLTPGLKPDTGAPPLAHNTPRAQAEPAVNAWLPTLLPPATNVVAQVTWTDALTGLARSRLVTQFDLGLQPIDLLWAVRPAGSSTMTDLDDRILGSVLRTDNPRPDVELTIHYTDRSAGHLTFFELSPLITVLRTLLTTARPLRPTDLASAAGTDPADRAADQAVSLPRERPAAVRASMDVLRTGVESYLATLAPLYPAGAPPQQTQILALVDTLLSGYAALVTTAGGFGMVRSGWGELAMWRRGVFTDVLAAVATAADRMTRALASADALLATYDALPAATSAAERFRLLQQAERLIATKPTAPLPAQPFAFRAIVAGRRQAFATKVQSLRSEARTIRTTLSGLLTEVAGKLPLSDFDPTDLSLQPFQDRVVQFCRDLLDRANALHADVLARLAAADQALAAYDAAVTGPDQVAAATDALKALIGQDVLAVPEFTPSAQLAADWRNALADSGTLVQHLTQPPIGRDFPVDDWAHGIARVRDRPRLWEKVVVLSDALRGPGGLLGDLLQSAEPQLVPIQLPYRPHDHWLAMEFSPGTTGADITEDKVLFTAHYAPDPVAPSPTQVGLLFDEWTEVIPSERETTGIALHYDGPDSEPPQAMLLVVPPVRTGAWNTDDLIAAVGETLDLAKARGVEPEHLDNTAYAQLLPATLMSATRQPITISTDLAIANQRWKATHA
ncbi:hypothetical protein [Kitasatospora sp. CB01950]|uniref:hypothetical protein n=1 Tax=Kitasatospora sp. CB01950 TaxID=1703930 RepID=UPI00093D48C8|nr:hypothetical protein [Kitasatospora sp. CB01950]OKJ09181.1 hypothetical protein AMK19_17495 [Kitasatospora sp. CB01950]